MTPMGPPMELYRIDPRIDLPRLREFLTTSDPDDYLLEGIEDWIGEDRLLVGREHGSWVAFGRLHDLGNSEGWVSGLRVAASRRGQGLGRRFLERILDEARGQSLTALRAVIEDRNTVSRRLFDRSGFRSVAELTLRRGLAQKGGTRPLRRGTTEDRLPGPIGWVPGATGRVDVLPGSDGGRFGRWRPSLVERFAREQKLYVGAGLAVAVQQDWWAHPRTLWVNPLVGETTTLVRALGALADSLHHEEWQAFLPSSDALRAEYDRCGTLLHPHWGEHVQLYERIDPGEPPVEGLRATSTSGARPPVARGGGPPP